MPSFIGYSSVTRNKKFTLTDEELVRQDLLNAFNIRHGQLPGVPGYGTSLWDFVFEPQTQDTMEQIIREVIRVGSLDPRVAIQDVQVFPWDNGILIQLVVAIVPSSEAEMLGIFFNQSTNIASLASVSTQTPAV